MFGRRHLSPSLPPRRDRRARIPAAGAARGVPDVAADAAPSTGLALLADAAVLVPLLARFGGF